MGRERAGAVLRGVLARGLLMLPPRVETPQQVALTLPVQSQFMAGEVFGIAISENGRDTFYRSGHGSFPLLGLASSRPLARRLGAPWF